MIIQCVYFVFGFPFINVWVIPIIWKFQGISIPWLGESKAIALINPPAQHTQQYECCLIQ